jgi:heparan-alpha-glucosaminide N-acetyltransferase
VSQPSPGTRRIAAIDAFRGLTIVAMIFVNELAGIGGIPQWAMHMPADADAMSFVDVVFPAFLFIVGMAIPFAVSARESAGGSRADILGHGLIRGLGLVVIGVFMVNTIAGFDAERMPVSIHAWTLVMYLCVATIWLRYPRHANKSRVLAMRACGGLGLVILWWIYTGTNGGHMTTQWWGILGLIGWAYLIALPIYMLANGIGPLAMAILALFGAYYASDGVFGHASHAAIVLSGTVLAMIVYRRNAAQRLREVSLFAVGTLALALLSWQLFPISKIFATPTWALFSSLACAVCFLTIHILLGRGRGATCARLLGPAAQNPLLLYILPYIIAASLGLLDLPVRPAAMSAGLAGVLWVLIFTAGVMWAGALLTKAGLQLKL